MRRYIFYLAVALLTFGIGLIVVTNFHKKTVAPILVKPERTEYLSDDFQEEEIKYGCEEKELEAFWEKLDKKAFLDFKKAQMKKFFYKGFPDLLEQQWNEFSRNFSCSYFGYSKEADLNGDGQNEIFITGEITSNRADSETFVFQIKHGKYVTILYDIASLEDEIVKGKTKNYFNLKFTTNWTGGGRSIRIYKFNGKNYEEKECFGEDNYIFKNGDIVELEKPIVQRVPCD